MLKSIDELFCNNMPLVSINSIKMMIFHWPMNHYTVALFWLKSLFTIRKHKLKSCSSKNCMTFLFIESKFDKSLFCIFFLVDLFNSNEKRKQIFGVKMRQIACRLRTNQITKSSWQFYTQQYDWFVVLSKMNILHRYSLSRILTANWSQFSEFKLRPAWSKWWP